MTNIVRRGEEKGTGGNCIALGFPRVQLGLRGGLLPSPPAFSPRVFLPSPPPSPSQYLVLLVGGCEEMSAPPGPHHHLGLGLSQMVDDDDDDDAQATIDVDVWEHQPPPPPPPPALLAPHVPSSQMQMPSAATASFLTSIERSRFQLDDHLRLLDELASHPLRGDGAGGVLASGYAAGAQAASLRQRTYQALAGLERAAQQQNQREQRQRPGRNTRNLTRLLSEGQRVGSVVDPVSGVEFPAESFRAQQNMFPIQTRPAGAADSGQDIRRLFTRPSPRRPNLFDSSDATAERRADDGDGDGEFDDGDNVGDEETFDTDTPMSRAAAMFAVSRARAEEACLREPLVALGGAGPDADEDADASAAVLSPRLDRGSPSQLPSALDTRALGSFLSVSRDKLEVSYHGVGQHSNDVGAVRADTAVPMDVAVYYYEVHILSFGERGTIGVGFTPPDGKISRQPGWDASSYGYHGDDGHKFHASGRGIPYASPFQAGDVVGAGIHHGRREVFFTLNGQHLGVAFRDVAAPLVPTVGLHSHGERVRINFGPEASRLRAARCREEGTLPSPPDPEPFLFDLEAYMQEEAKAEADAIQATEIPSSACLDAVRSYLQHHGFGATLEALSRTAPESMPVATSPKQRPESAALSERCAIREAVLDGDAIRVENILRSNGRGHLVACHDGPVALRLALLQFVELVREGDMAAAAQLAQDRMSVAHRRFDGRKDRSSVYCDDDEDGSRFCMRMDLAPYDYGAYADKIGGYELIKRVYAVCANGSSRVPLAPQDVAPAPPPHSQVVDARATERLIDDVAALLCYSCSGTNGSLKPPKELEYLLSPSFRAECADVLNWCVMLDEACRSRISGTKDLNNTTMERGSPRYPYILATSLAEAVSAYGSSDSWLSNPYEPRESTASSLHVDPIGRPMPTSNALETLLRMLIVTEKAARSANKGRGAVFSLSDAICTNTSAAAAAAATTTTTG